MSQTSDLAGIVGEAKEPVRQESEYRGELNAGAVDELRGLLAGVDTVVVTTLDGERQLRSRPMHLLQVDEWARLWFFVRASTDWVVAVPHSSAVNVTMADAPNARWISIAGRGNVLYDEVRNGDLWAVGGRAPFTGPGDPDLRLLCVTAEVADYWDAPHGPKNRMVSMAKALLRGDRDPISQDHNTLELTPNAESPTPPQLK